MHRFNRLILGAVAVRAIAQIIAELLGPFEASIGSQLNEFVYFPIALRHQTILILCCFFPVLVYDTLRTAVPRAIRVFNPNFSTKGRKAPLFFQSLLPIAVIGGALGIVYSYFVEDVYFFSICFLGRNLSQAVSSDAG